MKRKVWPLLILIALLMIAGGVLFFREVTVLHLMNLDHPKSIRIKIRPSDLLSIFYVHSIYREPVSEEFEVVGEIFVLRGVRTKSPGVMEYYGFEEVEEFHPMNKRLGAVLTIRRGTGEEQGLIVRNQKIFLSEIGEIGDRIQLRIESIPLGRYLLSKVF